MFFHRQTVKMVWRNGEEAVCPNCGHNNAMLHTGQVGTAHFYECRDCHLIVATGGGREGPEIDGYVIARSLGRSCDKCHSFNIVEYSEHTKSRIREQYRKEGKNVNAAPDHFCDICGNEIRYGF